MSNKLVCAKAGPSQKNIYGGNGGVLKELLNKNKNC